MLKERYGIPYYYGLPFGVKGSIEWMNDIACMLGLSLSRKILVEEMEKYGFSILELVNFLQNVDHLRVMISCPSDYSLGLTRLMRDEWGIEPSLVVLPRPDSTSLEEAIAGINPHILFGNSYDLLLAKNVPIKVHAAFPAFDHIYRYDGTPFVGLRGHSYLTQTIINLLNQNPEVFRN